MASLQYVIDTICSRLTVESLYGIVRLRLSQGPFEIADIVPSVRTEDRSLDHESARMLAEAACEDLVERGEMRMEGDRIFAL